MDTQLQMHGQNNVHSIGWYASQSPVLAAARNSTLVGLLGASAALLCLLVALGK